MEVDSEREYGVINDEGEHMEFHSDRVFSEMGLGDVPEVVAQCCVPLHPPPLQGSDISALLKIVCGKGWCRSPQIRFTKVLRGVSNEIP